MNLPPENAVRVNHERLESFVSAIAKASGLVAEKAQLLASLLTRNELRGVVSHGTIQIATYARLIRDGKLNPNPDISVERETPVSLLVTGDGGLGYFPAYEGTRKLAEKAKDTGLAILVTQNHGHFGAAGIYARIPLEYDLATFVTSGHQLNLNPDAPHYSAAGGSPIAFGVPANSRPIVVDFGAMHDLYASSPHRDEIARLAPGLVLRSIGLGEVCQTLGGMLSGLNFDPQPPRWDWSGANQGSLVISFRIDLFTDPDRFKTQVDSYVERIRGLTPIPGFTESFAAGDIESFYERSYLADGIPLAGDTVGKLNDVAEELGVSDRL